jgi:hypothetical protein
MNPETALSLLIDAAHMAQLPYRDHMKINEAAKVLVELIPKEPEPEEPMPDA